MTRIDFYTEAEDKHKTACLLCAKAVGQGIRVWVLTPDEEKTNFMDSLLWRYPATGFIPHLKSSDPRASEMPVQVGYELTNPPHEEILLNLGEEWHPDFSRFERLIEIVSLDDVDKKSARERYKNYRDRGYEIFTHKLTELTKN